MTATAYRLLHGEHGGAVDEPPRPASKPATEAQALLLAHLWLVPVRCRALRVRGPARDDVEQDGRLALWRAAVRFDPNRGVPFEHYARVWVDNAIKASLCQLGPVRTPVDVASARVARGERAHPQTLPYLEACADGEHAAAGLVREVAQRAHSGSELEVVDLVDRRRAAAWLESRLDELPRRQADVLRLAADVGTMACARHAGVHRATVQRLTKRGLAYLRAEAIGDGVAL